MKKGNHYETDAYIFLDIKKPHVAWATYRGILATVLPEPHGFISLWYADMLEKRGTSHYKKEILLEKVRQDQFPYKISRLTGLFCFPEISSAKSAARLWNSSGKDNFNMENLVEISLAEAKGDDIFDSNWITYSQGNPKSQKEWMQSYWNGDSFPGEEPVWEKLVEGNIAVLGTELRERAYEKVKAQWPDSLMQLEISRLAAWIGSDLGVIQAFLRNSDNEYIVEYLINWKDAENPEFLSKLTELIKGGHPVNWNDIQPWYDQGSFGHTPDMTAFGFAMPKQE